MKVVAEIKEVRDLVRRARLSGKQIGFVPTMGALHRGHLRLVEEARKSCDFIVLSVFVNAMQFNSLADLEHYPRTLEDDIEKASGAGVDVLFAPKEEEVYPGDLPRRNAQGQRTTVAAGVRSKGLCGAGRPGHFDGVVTVVSILFNIVLPDVAVFGEKDFQQLRVIEQLVSDLHFPLSIVAVPTVRDEDGLAMSSRNALLSVEDRVQALRISEALKQAEKDTAAGERSVSRLIDKAVRHIEAGGVVRVEYAKIVDVLSLESLSEIVDEAQFLVAARVGGVRLIDNTRLRTA